MSDQETELTKTSFAKTFVLPALSVFLIPAISLFFFLHAQSNYDRQVRESILRDIEQDNSLSEDDRQAAIDLYTQVPFSKLLQQPEFAEWADSGLVNQYRQFRWMIWLSLASIIASIAVFVLGGICVALSMRSQRAQYLSLASGWHVLRVFAAAQTIAQGIMAVALSFWVTALWFEVFIIKLIAIVGIVVLCGAGAGDYGNLQESQTGL